MGREQKQRHTLAERLIHKVCSELHANVARRLVFREYETFPCTPLPFFLCATRPNLRATTSLLSVGYFGLQTLQFVAQGDDLVGMALIIFLWTVLATSTTFGCSSKWNRELMGSALSAGRICQWNDWTCSLEFIKWRCWTKNCRASGKLWLFKA